MDSIFTKFGIVGMVNASANWDKWNRIAENMVNHDDQKIKIAMVGKYVTLADSYVSVNHALKHAGAAIGKAIDIDWIDPESNTLCLRGDFELVVFSPGRDFFQVERESSFDVFDRAGFEEFGVVGKCSFLGDNVGKGAIKDVVERRRRDSALRDASTVVLERRLSAVVDNSLRAALEETGIPADDVGMKGGVDELGDQDIMTN
jgi:hypothetical protein